MQAEPASWSPGAHPLTAEDPPSIGAYRLLGRLGEGGMGAVYLGLSDSGQKVAVKVIRRELAGTASFRARFGSEVDHAQRVASFCTARVLEHGELDGRPYLVTEHIDGPSLADYVEANGALSAGPLRSLAVGVATALTAIHAVRLVHRDLKPGNVLLSPTGPRVIDFGIARALDSDERHTQTGGFVGSPGWVAPEQLFDGQVSTAVDVFAWGTLIAYAATGRHPYGTGNLATLAARAQQGQHDLTGVPAELLPLVRAALAPTSAGRPRADALLTGLVGTSTDPQHAATDIISREWIPGQFSPMPRPASPATREDRLSDIPAAASAPRRRIWLTTVLSSVATALIVGAGSTAIVLLQEDDHPRDSGDRGSTSAANAKKSAGIVKVADVCSLVPKEASDKYVPEAIVRPSSNVPQEKVSTEGARTGCGWSSDIQTDSDIQNARTLNVKITLHRDAENQTGVAAASTDYTKRELVEKARAGKKVEGITYSPVTPVTGIATHAFLLTMERKHPGRDRQNEPAIGGAIMILQHANLVIDIRYAGDDYPTKDYDRTSSLGLDSARQAAEKIAGDVTKNLESCSECRG